MKIFDKLKRNIRACGDVFFPRMCVVCNSRLALDEDQVCASCLHRLPVVHFSSLKDNPMTNRFVGLIPINRAASLFYYQKGAAISKILFDLKYHDNPQVGYVLGRYLARQLQHRGFFDDIDTIIPVPLSKSRKWHRGYNQSEWLARGIASVANLPVDVQSVCRIRNNPTQTHLDRQERLANVQSLFAITSHASTLCGKHVLLVDDVFTTGATLLSLGEVLNTLSDIRFSVLTLACTKA